MNARSMSLWLALVLLIEIFCASAVAVVAQTQAYKPSTSSAPRSKQESSAASHAKVSLILGSVTVWLGMPQTEALAQFESAGYKVFGDGDTRAISIGNSPSMIAFRAGKLLYATREWELTEKDEMETVIDALTVFASAGAESCSITPRHNTMLNGSSDNIFINCGERSLMLVKGTFRNEQGVNPVVEVQERIGVR